MKTGARATVTVLTMTMHAKLNEKSLPLPVLLLAASKIWQRERQVLAVRAALGGELNFATRAREYAEWAAGTPRALREKAGWV